MRDRGQGYVMLYEMLIGKGKIQGGGKLKRHLMQYKELLEKSLAGKMAAKGFSEDTSVEYLLPSNAKRRKFPRYARVNLVTWSQGTEAIASVLRKEGLEVKVDDVVPSLLVMPPGTDLHEHPMVKDGTLVLQDKSSCFSAQALLEDFSFVPSTRGSVCDIIDACAAPGNKTMHLASLLHADARVSASGSRCDRRIYAFDKDPKRLELMRGRLHASGLGKEAIKTLWQDFLEVNTNDPRFENVRAILLDPSCSGSGVVSSPDRIHELGAVEESQKDIAATARIEKLATFQLAVLLKAMSFPKVRRICYSTCSVHPEENEAVVMKALHQHHQHRRQQQQEHEQDEENKSPRSDSANESTIASESLTAASDKTDRDVPVQPPFMLKKCLPTWPRRGQVVAGADAQSASCMIRTDPDKDATNGFFVALLERQSSMPTADILSVKSTNGKRRNRHKNRKKVKRRKQTPGEATDCEGCVTQGDQILR